MSHGDSATNKFAKRVGYSVVAISVPIFGFGFIGFGFFLLAPLIMGPPRGGGGDKAFIFGVFFGIAILGLAVFLLGRHFVRLSRDTDIPALDKEFLICSIVNGLLGVALAFGAISFLIADEGGTEIFSIGWSLSAFLLLTALFLTVKKVVYGTNWLMIIGGIISLPIGILPLLLGIRLGIVTKRLQTSAPMNE